VWGYDVSVARSTREFLDLTNVTATGMRIQGSGRATITTAPIYAPGSPHAITGAGLVRRTVLADASGRLRFDVDLGGSHRYEESSAAEMLLSLRSGYWTVRNVRIG
jgi:hypothetical protein